jgi:hypothetical protein
VIPERAHDANVETKQLRNMIQYIRLASHVMVQRRPRSPHKPLEISLALGLEKSFARRRVGLPVGSLVLYTVI